MKTIIAIAAATLAFPAVAQDRPAPPASTVAAPAQSGATVAKKERRYCIEGSMTGSRIARRDCRTRAQWMKDGFDPLIPDK